MTTLQNLIDATRYRTNMESSQFVTDVELTGYLNASLAEMDDLLVETYEDYKITSVTNTITTGNTFSLPTDFLKVRGVDLSMNGRWITLKRFNFQDRNKDADRYVFTNQYSVNLTYKVAGSTVMIEPEASATGTYRLWYTPCYTVLVAANDLAAYMDTQAWSEYAVVDAAIKVLAKQNLDPSVFMQQKEALRQRILSASNSRDAGSPKKVVDRRSGNDSDW